MKLFRKIICVSMLFLLVVSATGCNVSTHRKEFTYPDYRLADRESESWEQWKDYDDNVIEIDWYVDLAGFSWAGNNKSKVSDVILEKTGVKINFVSPLNSDSQMLNTLISSNLLPDLVTIMGNSSERVQLSEEGYIYPLNELADRWAPKLMDKVEQEIYDYFKATDGNLYGLSQGYYTDADLALYDEMGENLVSNGAIVARKDYLDAYCAYMKSADPSWKDSAACTPSGFIEMCKWIKKKYDLTDANPTVCLAPFDTTTATSGNKGISWLMEYFCVPTEDSEGNLTYQYAENEFREIVAFLNDLYTNGLISSSNLSANTSTVGSYIQQGLPFACILSPQDYNAYYKEWYLDNEDKQYVPIVMTNSAGDAPLLRDASGKGYRFTMVSTNCKRPDRVVKLLDFLYSDEGQALLWLGIEGDHYEYVVEPGGTFETEITVDGVPTKQTVTTPYGKIEWSDNMNNMLSSGTLSSKEGVMSFSLISDPMFPYLVSPNGKWVFRFDQYIWYNLKAPLFDYTYSHKKLEYPYDTSDPIKLVEMMNLKSKLEALWVQYLPRMISAESTSAAMELYEKTLANAERHGYKKLLEWQNAAFKAYKRKEGITYGWPKNDPDSDYHGWEVTSIYGNRDYVLAIPDYIVRK